MITRILGLVLTSGRRRLLIAISVAAVAWGLPPSEAAGATFTVNSTADQVDATPGDGRCSIGRTRVITCTLRAAIMEANALAGVSHTIVLPAGTYTLTIAGPNENGGANGDLDVKRSMTIMASGGLARIRGNNGPVWDDRIFHVFAGATLTMSGVEIANGNPTGNGGAILIESSGTLKLASSTVRDSASGLSGAGIFNAGTLTLVDSTVRDNISSSMAGGIHNGGVMTLVRSQVIGNTAGSGGGGIFNGGGVRASVVMVDSTIEGNRAAAGDSGGGIMNNGQLTIDRSTISQNGAGEDGGGIFQFGVSAFLTLTNSTLSGNVAGAGFFGGGISNIDGTATLNNVTITSNTAAQGGGISHFAAPVGPFPVTGIFSVRNSIVGGNGASVSPDCLGSINSQGFNLVQNTQGCVLDGASPGNITGLAPRLGVLQNNGGPTKTHGLCTGVGIPEASCAAASPAIGTASPDVDPGIPGTVVLGACANSDQRGVGRPQGTRCDIGAFEVAPVGAFLVTPGEAAVEAGEALFLEFTWTHTHRWRT